MAYHVAKINLVTIDVGCLTTVEIAVLGWSTTSEKLRNHFRAEFMFLFSVTANHVREGPYMWGWGLESGKPQKHDNLFLGRDLNLNDSHCKVQTPCQYLHKRRTMIILLQKQLLFGCSFRPFLSSPSSSWSSFSSTLVVCSAQADTPQKCCNERASKAPILQSSLPSHLLSLSSQMDGEQHLFGQSSNSILRQALFPNIMSPLNWRKH